MPVQIGRAAIGIPIILGVIHLETRRWHPLSTSRESVVSADLVEIQHVEPPNLPLLQEPSCSPTKTVPADRTTKNGPQRSAGTKLGRSSPKWFQLQAVAAVAEAEPPPDRQGNLRRTPTHVVPRKKLGEQAPAESGHKGPPVGRENLATGAFQYRPSNPLEKVLMTAGRTQIWAAPG